MRTTAAQFALMALIATAAGPANANDAARAACMESSLLEDVVACLASVDPQRACSPAKDGTSPVLPSGRVVLRFGQRTPYGTTAKGVGLLASPSAAVHSPASGVILYAGEFRTYGRFIVMEASCELRFVLAGLGSLAVTAGDTVSAGQILGHLPAGGPEGAVLTVELLHKSGVRLDPEPAVAGN